MALGVFKKKPDVLATRERELSERIASLEEQIQGLNRRIAQEQAQPKLRSTALPHTTSARPAAEPAFEPVRPPAAAPASQAEPPAGLYNELGVRKYDLAGAWRRWVAWWRGEGRANHRLVGYLAAGSLRGLPSLRYEQRLARNRCMRLLLVFVVVVAGLIYAYLHNQ